MARVLGIDIGTTSISALVLDTDRHQVVQKATRPGQAFLDGGDPTCREQHCQVILDCLRRVLLDLQDQDPRALEVDALSITGQMHGGLLLDRNRNPVTPLITWQDRRTLDRAPSGSRWIDEYNSLAGPSARQKTGMSPAPGFLGPTLFMLCQQNRIPADTRYLSLMDGWIAAVLAGRRNTDLAIDVSFAQSSGLYLPWEKKWNESLVHAMGLDVACLPRVSETGSCVAETAETDFPLRSGVPIFSGPGDNQASVLGSLRDLDTSLLLNVGTGGQVSVVTDTCTIQEGIDTRVFPGNRFMLVGASLSGGRAFTLLKEFVKGIGTDMFNCSLDDEILYEKLTRLAAEDTDLMCQTTFHGTRTDAGARGGITNLSDVNFTISDLSGAMLVGIIRELFDLFRKLGKERTFLVGSGNGIRRNRMLRRKAELAFGRKLHLPAIEEEACLGAALCAAVGLGVVPSFADASGTVRYVGE